MKSAPKGAERSLYLFLCYHFFVFNFRCDSYSFFVSFSIGYFYWFFHLSFSGHSTFLFHCFFSSVVFVNSCFFVPYFDQVVSSISTCSLLFMFRFITRPPCSTFLVSY